MPPLPRNTILACDRLRSAPDAIHNLHGTCSAVRQIAAVQNQVWSCLPQIHQDCLKSGSVTVDVRYDCDAHHHLRTNLPQYGSC